MRAIERVLRQISTRYAVVADRVLNDPAGLISEAAMLREAREMRGMSAQSMQDEADALEEAASAGLEKDGEALLSPVSTLPTASSLNSVASTSAADSAFAPQYSERSTTWVPQGLRDVSAPECHVHMNDAALRVLHSTTDELEAALDEIYSTWTFATPASHRSAMAREGADALLHKTLSHSVKVLLRQLAGADSKVRSMLRGVSAAGGAASSQSAAKAGAGETAEQAAGQDGSESLEAGAEEVAAAEIGGESGMTGEEDGGVDSADATASAVELMTEVDDDTTSADVAQPPVAAAEESTSLVSDYAATAEDTSTVDDFHPGREASALSTDNDSSAEVAGEASGDWALSAVVKEEIVDDKMDDVTEVQHDASHVTQDPNEATNAPIKTEEMTD